MSTVICSCSDPQFANTGRPDCVIQMRALSFPILVPRFQADGVTRNTVNVASATVGTTILGLLQNSTAVQSRWYPIPRAENVTFERSESIYETFPSGRKEKIDGVGGVRTMKFQLIGKDAVHQILRELKKIGCTDVDVFLVDVAGSIWGIKDTATTTTMRGYEMATETFDAFKEYASDTTTQKIMISFDLDSAECEEKSYAITSGELGYKATTLGGLISGTQVLTAPLATTVQSIVSTGFGTAGASGKVVGLVTANFTIFNETTQLAVVVSGAVETAAGTYTLTMLAQTASDVLTVSVVGATGYDVADNTVVAI